MYEKMKNWNDIEIKKTEELTEENWMLGYFHSSHDDWDKRSWVRDLNVLRIRDLALFALGDVEGKCILDIGCGPGIYMEIIARMGGKVSGQDVSPQETEKALKRFKEKGFDATIKAGDATQRLLFEDNSFDAVFSADFFHFINYEDKNKVMSEIYRVLKPGGRVVIKTLNLDYLKTSLFIKRALAILKLKSPFKIHIPHTHNNPDNRHIGLTTYREMEKVLQNNMFHSPEIMYVPLTKKNLPAAITRFLYGKKRFTPEIIITARKALFYGFYP